MDILYEIMQFAARAPEWVALAVCPGLILLSALIFTLAGGRKAYPFVAAALCGVQFSLLSVREERSALFCLGLSVTASALFALLFLIPRPRRGKKKENRAEQIYRKFREELSEPADRAESQPPKVCCFEEPPAERVSPEESGMRLSHADSLLAKLRTVKLSAGDRLEADSLARTLDAYRGRSLTSEELRALNDCLATVLRLTAKYKL